MSNILLYATVVAVWGSSWLVTKYQFGIVIPEASVAYRFLASAAMLILWCWLRRIRMRFTARQHAFIALQGVLLFSLNYILFYLAIELVTSGLVAVVFSTVVAMNIVFGAIFLGAPIRPRVVAGAALGLAGLVLIFRRDLAAFDLGNDGLIGLGLSLVATAFASLGHIASARNQRAGIPVLQNNAFGMAYGALFTLAVIGVRGQPLAFDPSFQYVSSLFYLTVFASIVGFGCYMTLIGRIGADRAAYASVALPVVALGLSTAFEGYVWAPSAVAGVACIIVGNVIVLTRIGGARAPACSRA